ncbi:hypothetical protein Tco_0822930 [Tanacetum coccineum]|uniref:Uncharacterized protein n=1 Tax=Tanacetum coccineum TaxID=301880 RepID=A0ABQ5AGG8_9ASTR
MLRHSRKGARLGYAARPRLTLFITLVTGNITKKPSQFGPSNCQPTELQQSLSDFQDVTEEPKSVPKRDMDHGITLKHMQHYDLYWNKHRLPTHLFRRYLDDLGKLGSPVPDDLLEAVVDALRVRIVRIDYQEVAGMLLFDMMAFREQALRLILDLSSTVITLSSVFAAPSKLLSYMPYGPLFPVFCRWHLWAWPDEIHNSLGQFVVDIEILDTQVKH